MPPPVQLPHAISVICAAFKLMIGVVNANIALRPCAPLVVCKGATHQTPAAYKLAQRHVVGTTSSCHCSRGEGMDFHSLSPGRLVSSP